MVRHICCSAVMMFWILIFWDNITKHMLAKYVISQKRCTPNVDGNVLNSAHASPATDVKSQMCYWINAETQLDIFDVDYTM